MHKESLNLKEKNNGSATIVEMCFVFPIVIMVVITMLYMGLYALQSSILTGYAQRTALYSSRMVSIPDYNKLGNVSTDLEFDYWSVDGTGPDSNTITEIYAEKYPYRFWTSNIFGDNTAGKITSVENALKNILSDVGFLVGTIECEVDTSNYFIYQEVNVTITQKIDTPFFMTFLGISDKLELETKVQAGANCPAEFIRNVDFVYDIANIVSDGKVSTFVSKIKSVKDKFGI